MERIRPGVELETPALRETAAVPATTNTSPCHTVIVRYVYSSVRGRAAREESPPLQSNGQHLAVLSSPSSIQEERLCGPYRACALSPCRRLQLELRFFFNFQRVHDILEELS